MAKNHNAILVIDVGGNHLKLYATGHDNPVKIPSGPKMTAAKMARLVLKAVSGWDYSAVSIGYPGPVIHGHIMSEPYNLGRGWVGFDFAKAFDRPVRIVNDAAMQALGVYQGGRMLFLGLGTGLGSALILEGVLEPMELGHLPFKKKRTYEDYLGRRGLKRLGRKKWRRYVWKIVEHFRKALEVDHIVIGGGNAKLLKKLPPGVRLGSNATAFLGGIRLWRGAAHAASPGTPTPADARGGRRPGKPDSSPTGTL